MRQISLSSNKPLNGTPELPASKSISNRLLILDTLSKNGLQIQNLSTAEDTQNLRKLLKKWKATDILDCGHGGTTFRFLTAFLALKGYEGILTGSERMQERPIAPLVKALRICGAKITYMKKQGFPPLKFSSSKLISPDKAIKIDASISSQFITAILLIGCRLPDGLRLKLENTVVSSPYIQMTISLLKKCNIHCHVNNNKIEIKHNAIHASHFKVESDWSSAAYFVGFVSSIPNSEIKLKNILFESLQADKKILSLNKCFNFSYAWEDDGLLVSSNRQSISDKIEVINLLSSPDLIQTVVVMACIHRSKIRIYGTQTLYNKETNRVKALIDSLKPCKVEFSVLEGGCGIHVDAENFQLPSDISFKTFQDHRMAMALSLLSSEGEITIQYPEVVKKSFPHYWQEIEKVGVKVKREI